MHEEGGVTIQWEEVELSLKDAIACSVDGIISG